MVGPVSGFCRVPWARAVLSWGGGSSSAGLQAGQRGGQQVGPGCVGSKAQADSAGVAGQPAGDRKQPQSWAFGFPAPRGCSSKTSICSQAVRSMASCTNAHQIRFWSNPCRGRLARPVSLATRMRSSQRARRRWRSSRSSSCPRQVLVTNAVSRNPSRSVKRNWAPGWLSWTRSAVLVLPPVRFCGPLAEPGVRVSTHRALHGLCRQAWLARVQEFGILEPRYRSVRLVRGRG